MCIGLYVTSSRVGRQVVLVTKSEARRTTLGLMHGPPRSVDTSKALELAGIKLGSVLTGITGVSATAMIDALIDGERRPQVMADLARGTLRAAGKQADLKMALAGRFTAHHATLLRRCLERLVR